MSNISKKKKAAIYTLLFFSILCVATWGIYNVFRDSVTPEQIKQIDHIRAKVLYHTDHKELLEVCRKKMATYRESSPEDKVNNESTSITVQTLSDNSQKEIDTSVKTGPGFGEVEDVPKRIHMQILDLKPAFVYISSENVDLEMCTGFYSVSVMAFSEGIEGYGDLKLIDGLWYNDDGFRKYPNFSDYLEKLRPIEDK